MRTVHPLRLPTALLAALLALSMGPAPARAGLVFNVAFDDPGGANSGYYAGITSHVQAAGADWASHLAGSASLEVIVQFSTGIPRATGRSLTGGFVGVNPADGRNVFDQGAAAEIRAGIDPNGAAPDVELVFNPAYLAGELWFDPDPAHRTAPVPVTRTDAMSVFLHELGHALAFNGWSDGAGGFTVPNGESTFDRWLAYAGGQTYFTGPRAEAVYGGPVAVTGGNPNHLGNGAPGPGADVVPDLMNGVVFFRGQRYGISALDVAVLADAGLQTAQPTPAPAPPPLVLLGIGVATLAGYARLRGRRAGAAS